MNLDIAGILGRAWRITWNNKALWLLGILASLAGGGVNFILHNNFRTDGTPGGQPGNLPPELQQWLNQFEPNVVLAIIAGLVCVGLLLTLAFIALSVIGRGGLIGGVQLANAQGK